MEEGEHPTSSRAPGALTGSTLGGFPLLSLLGVGGMAEVYRSVDAPLQREVAVKVLPAHLAQDAGYVTRFRMEAQRVAALSHPHVVPVFRFGEDRGLLYLVMPLLAESLRDRMHREGVLEPTEAVQLIVQIAEALDTAHRYGLVHRDVKPENVLLDNDGRALLSDFGIAREMAALRDTKTARTLSPTGLPVGTPEYMAPEQLSGAVADQRADIYSLGVVLFELLTGHLPHDGATPYDVVASVLKELPPSPSVYNPAIWPALAEVVLRALARDPAQRYPNMPSFVAALQRAMLDRGINMSNSLLGAVPVGGPRASIPGTTHPDTALVPVAPAGVLERAGGVALDQRYYATPRWGDTRLPGQRRMWAVITVALLVVLAFGATTGVLLTLRVIGPGSVAGKGLPTMSPVSTSAIVATASPGASPTASPRVTPSATSVRHSGSGQPTAGPTPTATPIPTPTATPLLTPTMVVSSSPLTFQLYPSSQPKNCVAMQKLTNISAVDAQWSWTNAPAASGWQYNTTGFSSATFGFPPTLTMTTPAYSSVYVYIKTGITDPACAKNTSVVATISVTDGTGTQFNVQY